MIEVQQLSRCFGELKAVNNVSFKVSSGEVLGFLGPNGAGKSTTMKMITGFLAPTSGSVNIDGFDIENQPLQAKSILGYLPEGAPAYGDMLPIEFLKFIGEVRGLTDKLLKERIAEVTERLHLEQVLYQPIDTLSKGFKRRVGLAQAILHDPKVLILDEPTDGLDPNQKHEVRKLIQEMAKEKTIIISTHILEEVSVVCSRAIIIDKGEIVEDCTPHALEAQSEYHQAVTLSLSKPLDIIQKLENIPNIKKIVFDENASSYTLFPNHGHAIYHQIHQIAQQESWPLSEFHIEKGRLDEVFRNITKGEHV